MPTGWIRVSRKEPCRICGKADWCGISADGKVACCMRIPAGRQAHNGGWFHDLEGLPVHGRTLPIPVKGRGPGVTLEILAKDRCLGLEKLKLIGWRDSQYENKPAVLLPYRNELGEVVRNRLRLNLNKEDGERFKWGQGDTVLPYGLHNLEWIKKQGYCILVEGEVDTEVLFQAGFPALGVPGAQAWKPEWVKYISDMTVFCWQENDIAGQNFPLLVGKDFTCQGQNNELWGTLLVLKAPAAAKDAARVKKLFGEGFKAKIDELIDFNNCHYAYPAFPKKVGFDL